MCLSLPISAQAAAIGTRGVPANAAIDASNAPPKAEDSIVAPTPAKAETSPADGVQIGLLLPLSGPQAALGKAMLDAATLALYDMQRNRPLLRTVPKIRLLPRDTQGTPEGAQVAFREMAKARPAAILGPLFSTELEAVIPLLREENIPLIAFTNNPTLAGRGVYQFGYFAAEQAQKLAQYAARQKVKNVAAVAASDGYGRTVVDQLAKALKTEHLGFGPLVLLPPGKAASDVNEKTMAPLISALKGSAKQRQFLFIAEGSPRLEAIVLALAQARLLQPNLVLAGSGIWDEPTQLASPALRGAVFVSTPREGFGQFVKNYRIAYKQNPLRIASLAYDASALLVSLIYEGGPQAVTDRTLQDAEGFATPANGLVRFRADGQAERRLAIFMASGGGNARLLEAAPKSFDE